MNGDRSTYWEEEYKRYESELDELSAEQESLAQAADIPLWKRALQISFPPAALPITAEIMESQKRLAEIKARQSEALIGAEKARWFANIYQQAPQLLLTGAISSTQDLLNIVPPNEKVQMTPEDLSELQSFIAGAAETPKATAPNMPDWLKVTPEEAGIVEKFIVEGRPAPIPVSLGAMTTEEILKSLKTAVIAKLPEGMDAEEFLRLAGLYGMTPEQINAATDPELQAALAELTSAYEEHNAMVDDVLAGLQDPNMGEWTLWQKIKFVSMQPFQAMADLMHPYFKYVNYPLTGLAIKIFNGWFKFDRDFDRYLEEAKASENFWMAAGTAYERWGDEKEVNILLRLAIEIVTDPLTYVGWGILTKVTKPLGMFGRAVGAFERGFNRVMDVPIDMFRSAWNKIPRTGSQIVRQQSDEFRSLITAATTKYASKPIHMITVDDVKSAMLHSIDHYRNFPMGEVSGVTDVYQQFGKSLLEHPYLVEDDILTWGAKLESKLTQVTARTVDDVNNIVEDTLVKHMSVQENAKRLTAVLGIEDTAPKLRATEQLLTKHIKSIESRATKLASMEVDDATALIRAVEDSQRAVIKAQVDSAFAASRQMGGVAAGLRNWVGRKEQTVWRNTINRTFVRPMAEAYLGFTGYPIWNAIEDISRSMLDGVLPRQMGPEEFKLFTQGLKTDARLISESASDIYGMLGTIPGRAPNTVSFIPSGRYWGWLGTHWIKFSNLWGNAFRRNFLVKKTINYEAEMLAKSGLKAYFDTMQQLCRDIPRISNKNLRDAMKNELFARLQARDPELVRAMKDIISNEALMKKQATEVLSHFPEITPGARGIIRKAIDNGKIWKDPHKVLKQAAKNAEKEISTYPESAAEGFGRFADELCALDVQSTEELMQMFQHSEIMIDISSSVPHKIMSRTHEITDRMASRGLHKEIPEVWSKQRGKMNEIMEQIADSNIRVRNRIIKELDNPASKAKLTTEQDSALRQLINMQNERQRLYSEARAIDSDILDTAYATPRERWTSDFHAAVRAKRKAVWEAFNKADAEALGLERISREQYAKLYNELPARKYYSVDVTQRAMAPADVAKVMGGTIDELYTSIAENMVMQDREHFIAILMKQAEAHPQYFKGVTADKLDEAYDVILDQMRMTPTKDIELQKIQQELQGCYTELMDIKTVRPLNEIEEKQLFNWVDNAADELSKMDIPSTEWDSIRQTAHDAALKDYYKAFTDYTHENAIDFTMRHIFPYWTYEFQRWAQFIPRTLLRRPGMWTAWGKYYDKSEYGYIHIPGTDVEVSLARGTVLGTTFSLARRDYPSYYSVMGTAGEMMEMGQRYGFYPGAHFMLPITLLPTLSGEPPELGEAMPTVFVTALSALRASGIPGVADSAEWLQQHILHERFREFKIERKISDMVAESDGALIQGQSGADIFAKIRAAKGKLPEALTEEGLTAMGLTPEEQAVYDEAAQWIAFYDVFNSQIPITRFRPDELIEANQKISDIIYQHTGYTPEQQEWLWRHNMRPTDLVSLDPNVRRQMNELWEMKLWSGASQVLMPPERKNLQMKISQFWDAVKSYQDDRIASQLEADTGFLTPTAEIHFDGREWREQRQALWAEYITKFNSLKEQDDYMDVPLTLEERVKIFKERGYFTAPNAHPLDDILELYYSLGMAEDPDTGRWEIRMRRDRYSGEYVPDYQGMYAERQALINALPDDQRAEFEKFVRERETPLERKFKDVVETYFRGYWAVNELMARTRTDLERQLIAEYYADSTSLSRKEEIQAMEDSSGLKLISHFSTECSDARERLREAIPTLDFWLYVFGYVTKPRTDTAQDMINKWEADKKTIVE